MLDFSKVSWEKVLPAFGINKDYLSPKAGPCPICSRGNRGLRRFRFDNKGKVGTWFCQSCGAGNGFTLIQKFTGKASVDILKEIEEVNDQDASFDPSTPPIPLASMEFTEEEVIRNRLRLNEAQGGSQKRIDTDPVSIYLSARVPKCNLNALSRYIRFNPSMPYYEEQFKAEKGGRKKFVLRGRFPVMLAVVVDGQGTRITLHRTFLTWEGKKAPFEDVKRQMSGVRKLKGAAIRVCEVPESRTLGLAEGIETAYAIATGYRYTINVWSMLNCRNLSVADVPREHFDKVVIFADHDKFDEKAKYRPGTHFAGILKEKLLSEGFEVEVKVPPKEGEDFADIWMNICLNKK